MKIKALLSLAVFSILVFSVCTFSVTALKVDGVISELEWESAATEVLVNSSTKSNCDIVYGSVSILEDTKSNIIYLGFKANLSEAIIDIEVAENEFVENTNYGVAISVNSGDFVYITPDNVTEFDAEKYNFDTCVCAYSEYSYSAEVALGVKYGISSIESIDIRFVDSSSVPSNVYSVDVNLLVSSFDAETGTETVKTTSPRVPKTTVPNKSSVSNSNKPTTVISNDGYVVQTEQATSEFYSDEATTVLTASQLKLQKTFSYIALAALILLSLGICIVVNVMHDKKSEKKEPKKR